MYSDAHEDDSKPRDNAADYLWIAGAEEPAQIISLVVTENANGFDTDDPAGMEADGEIKGAGTREHVAQYHTDEPETDKPGSDR